MNRMQTGEEKILKLLKELCPDVITISLAHAARLVKKDPRSLMADERFPCKRINSHYHVALPLLAEYLARAENVY